MLLHREEYKDSTLVTTNGGVSFRGNVSKLNDKIFKDEKDQKVLDDILSVYTESCSKDFLLYIGDLKEIEENVMCLPPEELLGKRVSSKGSE